MFSILQCGKSAALYACAKEQGFDVIEVSCSPNRLCFGVKKLCMALSLAMLMNISLYLCAHIVFVET